MSMTDPIADFLTRIRNGIMAAHETVEIPSSKLKQEMARILTEQGYIEGFEIVPGEPGRAGDRIVVRLKYTESRESVISGLKRISRPGQRTYVDARSMPKVDSLPRWTRLPRSSANTTPPPSQTSFARPPWPSVCARNTGSTSG